MDWAVYKKWLTFFATTSRDSFARARAGRATAVTGFFCCQRKGPDYAVERGACSESRPGVGPRGRRAGAGGFTGGSGRLRREHERHAADAGGTGGSSGGHPDAGHDAGSVPLSCDNSMLVLEDNCTGLPHDRSRPRSRRPGSDVRRRRAAAGRQAGRDGDRDQRGDVRRQGQPAQPRNVAGDRHPHRQDQSASRAFAEARCRSGPRSSRRKISIVSRPGPTGSSTASDPNHDDDQNTCGDCGGRDRQFLHRSTCRSPSARRAAGKARVGVLSLRGAGEGVVRAKISAALKANGFLVVGTEQLESSASGLGVSLDSDKGLRAVAKELNVSAFVGGELSKKKASLTVRNGADGSVLGDDSFAGANPEEDRRRRRQHLLAPAGAGGAPGQAALGREDQGGDRRGGAAAARGGRRRKPRRARRRPPRRGRERSRGRWRNRSRRRLPSPRARRHLQAEGEAGRGRRGGRIGGRAARAHAGNRRQRHESIAELAPGPQQRARAVLAGRGARRPRSGSRPIRPRSARAGFASRIGIFGGFNQGFGVNSTANGGATKLTTVVPGLPRRRQAALAGEHLRAVSVGRVRRAVVQARRRRAARRR